ncbi:MAG: hypothetical protein C0498_01390 [Anaerolinea sp.]|nr:hypothetical protein [Anaerolinea sp.]
MSDHTAKHAQFRLFTGVLKSWQDEQTGERFVSGTTSSTIRDLQGDELTLNALESMRQSALDNMTVFLNHGTSVPEDIFGSVTGAAIVQRADPEAGDVYDLDITVRVAGDDENPRAGKVYRSIAAGRKLGLSIGAYVTSASRSSKGGEETFVIDGVRLLESSVVGIPANQRSYVLTRALKALRGQPADASEEGVAADLEERGLGDRIRAGILRNEAAARERLMAAATDKPISAEGDVDKTATDSGEAPEETTETETETEAPEASVESAEGQATEPAESAAPTGETATEPAETPADEPASGESAADDQEDEASVVLASLMPVTEKATEALRAALSTNADLRKRVGELEGDLEARSAELGKALELLTEALRLPVGRKAAVAAVTQKATAYPWLAPAVAAALDAAHTPKENVK